MKITQVAGFLGCGKTTLMLKLAQMVADDGKRKVALVVNEIGEIPVDAEVLEAGGMKVKPIGGGCICCEMSGPFGQALAEMRRFFNPDHVIVEPTGVAIPHQVKTAAMMGMRQGKIAMGASIVLFDATRPAELLDMDLMGVLVVNQVEDADVLAISKVDAVSAEVLKDVRERVHKLNEPAEMINLSSFTGEGLDQIVDVVLTWEAD